MRNRQPEPRYLAIGRVLRPHGVRGEVRMELLTDHPEHLAALDEVYLGRTKERREVQNVRLHQGVALLQLSGYEDRNAAEELRGELVYVSLEDAVPLEQDEYYEFQVEGLTVVSEEGQPLGEVVEVLTAPGANDIFVVRGPLGEILIPAIEDVVTGLDLEGGRMVVHLLPGLLDS